MEVEDGENNQPINKNPTREQHYYFKYTRHYMKLPECEFKGHKMLFHAAPETSESYENIVSKGAGQDTSPAPSGLKAASLMQNRRSIHKAQYAGLTAANKGRPGRLKGTGMGRDTAAGHPPSPHLMALGLPDSWLVSLHFKMPPLFKSPDTTSIYNISDRSATV